VSFSDNRTIAIRRPFGCMAYCIFATLLVVYMLLGAAMGDCADGPNGEGCSKYDGLIRFLMFPGSLILVIVIGIFLARWAMRNESDD
jgi:hypothetical protein